MDCSHPEADNPFSYAFGVVFGTDLSRKGKSGRAPTYSCGYADDAMRDYVVQATSIGGEESPRTPHLLRMYFVIGTLDKVAGKANQLAAHADYEPLKFTEDDVPLVPLYAKSVGNDTVLIDASLANGRTVRAECIGVPVPGPYRAVVAVPSSIGNAGLNSRKASADPVCSSYAWPVSGSYPLFLIRNNQANRHLVTTDPYAQCAREPFENPFEPGHEFHANFENRTVHHTYRRQTEWVELLGFVLPKDTVDNGSHNYAAMSGIAAAMESFDAGEKLNANDLVVRTD